MTAPVIDLNADVGERPGAEGIAADAAIIAGVRARTSPAAFTPATPPRCAPSARRRSRGTSGSARTSPTWTGRVSADATSRSTRTTLRQQIVQQIAALRIDGRRLSTGAVGYVKPHGALYNRAAVDPVYADAIVTAIAAVDRHLKLLGPPDSELLRAAAAHGLEGVAEGFADRAYRPDGTLVPRSEPGACSTRDAALDHAVAARRRRPLPFALHP